MRRNADGSVDIYFGPKAPAGQESNWIYTPAEKSWFPWFRFYGPDTGCADHEQSPPYQRTDAAEHYAKLINRNGRYRRFRHANSLTKRKPTVLNLMPPRESPALLDPSGRFFLRRVLPDDFRSGKTYGRRKLILDPIFQISELAEALLTGQRFASAMRYEWSSLEGRALASWAVPGVDFFAASNSSHRYSRF